MTIPSPQLDISSTVARALAEDLGDGDLTSALVASDTEILAEIRVREHATLCGTAWVDEVFHQIDGGVVVEWRYSDGQRIEADAIVCTVSGNARAILSGERTALNLLQTLSGTASVTAQYRAAIEGTSARILDTRKTLPGLRVAQKYAVRCGGGENHRIGLFDAVLIKENHIASVGGISKAVALARANSPNVMIEIEVEDLEQVDEALDTSADRLLLDEFSLDGLREAVEKRNSHLGRRKELEASGSIDLKGIRAIAETGVDYISVGAITKNLSAIDYSMRFV